MITTKPPITNFTPFHVTRVALLRQQREYNWLQAQQNKPTIVKLDGSGVVKPTKPRKDKKPQQITLLTGFEKLHPDIQRIMKEQLGLA